MMTGVSQRILHRLAGPLARGLRAGGPACLVLALAACQPAPRVIATGPFPPSAGARPSARPKVEPLDRQQDATWSFTVNGSACEARAAGPDVSLSLRASNDRTLRFILSTSQRAPLPGRAGSPAQVAFAGAEGSWSLPARHGAGRMMTVSLPLDETSVSQARFVLGGGAVRLAGRDAVPTLTIPDAGVAGRDWLGCVRSKLAG